MFKELFNLQKKGVMFNIDKNSIETEYYLVDNGSTIGPFSFDDIVIKIQEKSVKPKSQIYKDNKWLTAQDLPEFQHLFPKKKGLPDKMV